MAVLTNVLAPLAAEASGLVERVQKCVVLVHSQHGHGSGIVWDDRGLIITNHHVVGRGNAVVETGERRRIPATILGIDAYNDLAALRVEETGLAAPPIGDSTAMRLGELIVAVGNPFGMRGVATLGIVSGVGDMIWNGRHRRELLQADVDLAPGNSGGPLVDSDGNVVGVASMVMSPGVALAIPSYVVQRFVRSLHWAPSRAASYD
jgi:serine protease Do